MRIDADKSHDFIAGGFWNGGQFCIDLKRPFVSTDQKGVESDFTRTDFLDGCGCDENPWYIGQEELEEKKDGYRKVVTPVGGYGVIQYQRKKQDQYADQGKQESLAQLLES
jgi:hypothetical protein